MSRKLPGSAIVPGTITVTQITGGLNDTTNASYAQANTARTTANDAYGQANTARDQANTARTQANTAYDQANNARGQANTAYGQANNAYSSANLAYTQANSARSDVNTTFATVNTTFATLNTSAGTQNTNIGLAYDQANAARGQANTAYGQANAAYGAANTRLSASGGTLSGDLIITGNLTVSGNQTILNTEVLTTEDAEIILLSNTAGTPALNAGLIINRGTSTNTFLRWNETLDEWGWSDSGTTTYYFEDLRAGLATTNTTFGTVNTNITNTNSNALNAYASANLAYTQANNARSDANTTFATVNTTFATINTTTATMNTATSNRVLKAGDTMTGNLTLSAASLVASSTSNDQRVIDLDNTGASGRHAALPLRFMVGSASTGYPFAGYNAIPRANGAYSYSGSDTAWGISYGNSSRMGFYYAASGTAGANISFSELMSITSGGSVGIGTAAPGTRLHVYQTTNDATIRLETTTAGSYFEARSGTDGYAGLVLVGAGSEKFFVGSYGVDALQFSRSRTGTEFMRITSGGNVGIGTTNPSQRLEAFGTDAGVIVHNSGHSRGGIFALNTQRLALASTSIDDDILFGYGPSPMTTAGFVERMRIDNGTGNVGIGTTNPGGRLQIRGDGTAGTYQGVIRIDNTGADKWGAICLPDDASASNASNNYYLIGRTGSMSNRIMSFHIPTSSDYGGGSQPKFGFFSTGTDTLFTIEASTGLLFAKGSLNIDGTIGFRRASGDYGTYIRSNGYPAQGYANADGTKYWVELGAAGGVHIILNTDNGSGSAENSYDHFTVWQGSNNGDRLFHVTNVGNVVAKGNITNQSWKGHTFIPLTSAVTKTFTFTGNSTGSFPITDFSGVPSNAKGLLVYGWYHITGYGSGAGQGDHAVSWFGYVTNASVSTWSGPGAAWPGSGAFTTEYHGSFVMEHDGDASGSGNFMHYYGSWHQGIICPNADGNIRYNLGHGLSGGTHYNALYCVGYWI